MNRLRTSPSNAAVSFQFRLRSLLNVQPPIWTECDRVLQGGNPPPLEFPSSAHGGTSQHSEPLRLEIAETETRFLSLSRPTRVPLLPSGRLGRCIQFKSQEARSTPPQEAGPCNRGVDRTFGVWYTLRRSPPKYPNPANLALPHQDRYLNWSFELDGERCASVHNVLSPPRFPAILSNPLSCHKSGSARSCDTSASSKTSH